MGENELWDGTHIVKHDCRQGFFKWDLVNASKGHGFSISISRTLKTHETNTAHKLWSRLHTTENAAFLANCGQGVEATWAETAIEQGLLDGEWKTAVSRRLRLWIEEPRMCECGMIEDEKKEATRWPVRKALAGHEHKTKCATVLQDRFEEWVQPPTWRESLRNGQSSTQTNKEQISTVWRGSMLWPLFLEVTSCSG